MKKFVLLIIFLFIILPIIILGIIFADVFLTVSNFDVSQVQVDIDTPITNLSSDNTTLIFQTNISILIPQFGFIPKAVSATFQLYHDTTELGTPSTVTVDLGKTVNNQINQSITLTSDITDSLTQGSTVSIVLKSSAVISIFGFQIPYTIKLPDQTFTIP